MDDLIIRVLSGAASPFEEERLKRWRDEDEENEEHFQEMSRVWAVTAPEPAVQAWGPPDVGDIIQAADVGDPERTVISLESRQPSKERPAFGGRNLWRYGGLLAATVAALALGTRFVLFAGPEPLATYQAAGGQALTVTLDDGSFVRLADGSVLREWDVEGRREVTLEGRGFFAVGRDESRPFVVRAGPGEVRVLGTRFQVETGRDGVETVVVEGLVRISNQDGEVEVPAGSVGHLASTGLPTTQAVEDVYSLLDWSNGTLVFQGTPLSLVAHEVSRHYGRTLEVTGSELGSRRVTAWFMGEPFEAVAESLCLVTEALCRSVESGVSMQLENESGGV